jgi:hypothetical protein
LQVAKILIVPKDVLYLRRCGFLASLGAAIGNNGEGQPHFYEDILVFLGTEASLSAGISDRYAIII